MREKLASKIDQARRELWLTFRTFGRHPGFSGIVVLTLALGLGAATAIFSVFNAVVLRPLPFADADELYRVRQVIDLPGRGPTPASVAGSVLEQWEESGRIPGVEIAAGEYRSMALTGDQEPERVVGIAATWNFFDVLGARPQAGRAFLPSDGTPGSPAPVAILSDGLWNRWFGRSLDVVGSEVRINNAPYTVVGIAEPGFRYPYGAEIWVPLGLDPADSSAYHDRTLNVSVRVPPGSTPEAVQAELSALARPISEVSDLPILGATMTPVREEILEGTGPRVTALLGSGLFVLLIAALNVAAMFLARMQDTGRAFAVRIALGARRSDLARIWLYQAVILALAGGALGAVIAQWTSPALAAMSPLDDLGPYFSAAVSIDAATLLWATVAAIVVGGLTSLPSLIRLFSRGPARLLGRRDALGGDSRTLAGLVVFEIAFAVLLLTGAGLLTQSLHQLRSTDPGVETAGLWTFGFTPGSVDRETFEERRRMVDEVLERVRAVPGVDAAGITNLNPFRDQSWGARVWPEGRPATRADDQVVVNHRAVTEGFFEAAGTEVLRGRGFTRSDGADARGVAIVSRSAARTLWPGEEAIGKQIRRGSSSGGGEWLTVVGVVEDVDDAGDTGPTWYRPFHQDPDQFPGGSVELWVRLAGADPSSLVATVRDAIRDVEPDLALFNVEPVEAVLAFERRVESFAALLLGIFAAVGTALAGAGIYGVLSYAVGRRTREIGLRMALGAEPFQILRQVLGKAALLAGAGLVTGLFAAGMLTRFLESLLYQVDPLEPTVFVFMGVGAFAVALIAALVPARRASSVQPVVALSEE